MSVFHAVLGADFLIAVPVKCGTLEDWDYLKSDHSRATNFSQSDLLTNKHYEVEIKGGYGFSLGTEIQYKRVSLSLSYAYIECTDGESSQRNFGHATYLSDSDSKPGATAKTLTFLVTYHIQ